MRVTGIIGVFIILIVIIAGILLGNYFFSTFLGIDISKLPPFLKTFIHLLGLGVVLFLIKKFFAR
ncbi:hypothetical protein A2V49_03670 [candidate division WWE3 bacterium RBG_19FT_COMBO_34_6]|uniref:Uncharacterized protein n=1 Tax=candidate division WWE3 bacterium RBG_19FT_COMBO_34_6 TaxID=1802612 RepID=A0A1F4UN08_UNCKA|nr:MAG: hypothetical protein A2V49_03670 [candidate division WWE3 bacterium RBG_19FT_COMBO_34_6]